jgi:hypothetical protein
MSYSRRLVLMRDDFLFETNALYMGSRWLILLDDTTGSLTYKYRHIHI